MLMVSLKKNREFQHVYKRGRSFANKHIVLFVLTTNKDINRLGISASKKLGGAVCRNKQRRRIKEAFRAIASCITPGHDIVILPRAGVIEANFDEIGKGLIKLLLKHKIWRGGI